MNHPLWSDTNNTLYSSVFCVQPAHVCVLFADGLADWKWRTDSDVRIPQSIHIRKVLHEYDKQRSKQDLRPDWIFDIRRVSADKIADACIQTCGEPWSLRKCKNIGIIGVPGSYWLELNDSTAIGVAQVYAEMHSVKNFPVQLSDLFFR